MILFFSFLFSFTLVHKTSRLGKPGGSFCCYKSNFYAIWPQSGTHKNT